MSWQDDILAAKNAFESEVTQASANLDIKKADALAVIQATHDEAQVSINQQNQDLAAGIEHASKALLDNKLQPIVVNADKPSPLPYLAIGGVIMYYFFRRRT